ELAQSVTSARCSFRANKVSSGYCHLVIAVCALAMLAVILPGNLAAQCDPLATAAKTQTSQPGSALGRPEFFDEPAFTVAGVADTASGGGHASGMAQPRPETLAKGIAALGKGTNPAAADTSAPVSVPEKSLRDAVRKDPGSLEANRQLAKWLVQSGRERDALPYLQRTAELFASPGMNGPSKRAGDEAEIHHLLGEVREKLGDPLAAVREYQRAAELEPSESNLFDWGAELLLHGASEPAIEVFGKGTRVLPGSVRMLVGLGVALYSRGSVQEAAARLCNATDVNPADPTPYPFLSQTINPEFANSAGIVERLARFARLQPENAQANYYYALGLWKRRTSPQGREDLGQIRSLLEKAVRLDPTLGAAYLQLGISYSEQGDSAKAISAYEKAIAATPQLPEAHYRLAQAYRQAKETSKAQQELAAFQRATKEAADQEEQQKREIRQFVYTMQGSTPRQ
ncbi:MAG TPA: tetratricopeptide repeat protein, partial [Terriglobales bacterium]|nr:tetratricopeptide repeat protein [Terriglobales bacterium]